MEDEASNGNGLEAAFAQLSRIVLGDEPLPSILERVVRGANHLVALGRHRKVSDTASSTYRLLSGRLPRSPTPG